MKELNFKLGQKLQLNKNGELLMSNQHLLGKELEVTGLEATGLISQPYFVVITTDYENFESINPDFVTLITGV